MISAAGDESLIYFWADVNEVPVIWRRYLKMLVPSGKLFLNRNLAIFEDYTCCIMIRISSGCLETYARINYCTVPCVSDCTVPCVSACTVPCVSDCMVPCVSDGMVPCVSDCTVPCVSDCTVPCVSDCTVPCVSDCMVLYGPLCQ